MKKKAIEKKKSAAKKKEKITIMGKYHIPESGIQLLRNAVVTQKSIDIISKTPRHKLTKERRERLDKLNSELIDLNTMIEQRKKKWLKP